VPRFRFPRGLGLRFFGRRDFASFTPTPLFPASIAKALGGLFFRRHSPIEDFTGLFFGASFFSTPFRFSRKLSNGPGRVLNTFRDVARHLPDLLFYFVVVSPLL